MLPTYAHCVMLHHWLNMCEKSWNSISIWSTEGSAVRVIMVRAAWSRQLIQHKVQPSAVYMSCRDHAPKTIITRTSVLYGSFVGGRRRTPTSSDATLFGSFTLQLQSDWSARLPHAPIAIRELRVPVKMIIYTVLLRTLSVLYDEYRTGGAFYPPTQNTILHGCSSCARNTAWGVGSRSSIQ